MLNSHAFFGSTPIQAMVTADGSRCTVQQQSGNGPVQKFCINPHTWDIAFSPNYPGYMARQDTLFLAFAQAFPRSFDGCIWDAEQHAKQHAQDGALLDYEYMSYEQFLRRLTVQHICERWGEFEAFAAADHGAGISTVDLYRRLMLHKYSNTGLTEALALCDLYNCNHC